MVINYHAGERCKQEALAMAESVFDLMKKDPTNLYTVGIAMVMYSAMIEKFASDEISYLLNRAFDSNKEVDTK
jgi:hypothetical protein